MRTKIAVLGAGSLGLSVARLAMLGDFDVFLANSRDPETLDPIEAAFGRRITPAWANIAAMRADIVVVSVPLSSIRSLPSDELAGKIVLDTCNYYPDRDGVIKSLDGQQQTTSSLLQEVLPQSAVVKVFNNISWPSLQGLSTLDGAEDRSVLPVASDDLSAKSTVLELLLNLGWSGLDSGTLDDSWTFERSKPAYVRPYTLGGDVLRPSPLGATELIQRLGEAIRG